MQSQQHENTFLCSYRGPWISQLGFPGGTSGKEPACQCRRHRDLGLIPGVRKILWRREWQPIPVFLPENPMDRGAWQAIVHGAAKSWTQLKRLSRHRSQSRTLMGKWERRRSGLRPGALQLWAAMLRLGPEWHSRLIGISCAPQSGQSGESTRRVSLTLFSYKTWSLPGGVLRTDWHRFLGGLLPSNL